MFIDLIIIATIFLFFWGYFSSGIVINRSAEPLTLNPKNLDHNYDNFTVKTKDGIDLKCWFVAAKKLSDATIIMLHGWGENRSEILSRSIHLSQNYNLVYFDFRNHGQSQKAKTSLIALELRDIDAVLQHLKTEKPQTSKRIGLLGCSMGASVALTAAATHSEVLAVIAESPFASFNDTIKRYAVNLYFTPGFLVPVTLWFLRARLGINSEDFSPIKFVHLLSDRGLFLIQSDIDNRMPPFVGQSLFNAAKEPKEIWTVRGADHGQAHLPNPQQYAKRTTEFFQKHIPN